MSSRKDVHLLFIFDNVEKNKTMKEGISKCLKYFLEKNEKVSIAHKIINVNGHFFTRGEGGFSEGLGAMLNVIVAKSINVRAITVIFVSSCVSINPNFLLHKGIHDGEKLLYQAPLNLLNNFLGGFKDNAATPHQLLTILFPCTLHETYARDYQGETMDEERFDVPNNIVYRLNSVGEEDIDCMISFLKDKVDEFRVKNKLLNS